MFKRTHFASSAFQRGRSGEGTQSMLAFLRLDRVVPMVQDISLVDWIKTCPGSFDRLWDADLQHQRCQAEDAFAPTRAMDMPGA